MELLERMESIATQLRGDVPNDVLTNQVVEDPNMKIAAILRTALGDNVNVIIMWQNGKVVSKVCRCGAGAKVPMPSLVNTHATTLTNIWTIMHDLAAEQNGASQGEGAAAPEPDGISVTAIQKMLEERRP